MKLIDNYVESKVYNVLNKELGDDFFVAPSDVILSNEEFELLENKMWYYANNYKDLEYFYKTKMPQINEYVEDRTFYHSVKGKTPRVHVPLARNVTDTIVNLCFSETPGITVDTGNKVTNESYNKKLNAILNENDSTSLFKDFAANNSWSGAAAFKIILDKELSDNPIIQPYSKADIVVSKRAGRVYQIIFKDYFNEYILFSIYGIGYVKFKLFKGKKEVPLDSIEETAGLKDYEIVDKNGMKLNHMLAVYMENNNEASSDYKGSIDLMIAADEVKSAILAIQRTLKPYVYYPSSVCSYDRTTKKTKKPDNWDQNEIIVEDNNANQDKSPVDSIKRDFNSPSLNSYQDYYDRTVKDIYINTSLAESTITGYDGGSNSSGLALNIREKPSMRKRAALLTRFDKALGTLAEIVLELSNSELIDNKLAVKDLSNYKYYVNFSEYASPSFSDMIKDISLAKSSGLIDLHTALQELYGSDISDIDLAIMEENINKEKVSKEPEPEKEEEDPEETMNE